MLENFLYAILFLIMDFVVLITHKKYLKNLFFIILRKKKIEDLNLEDAEEFKGYSGTLMAIILTIVFIFYTLKEVI